MMDALEKLKDEKFRVASNFTIEDISQPVPKKILNSVLCAFTKVLATYCPYQEASGPAVARYFSQNFHEWFILHFTSLSSHPSVAKSLRSKSHGWFLTNLKRKLGKMKNLGNASAPILVSLDL